MPYDRILIQSPVTIFFSCCTVNITMPVSLAARSKAYVCGRSPAEIVVSNIIGAWMFVCCECCVLSGRGLCFGLITRPEKSYRLWCVAVCDLETSWMRRPWPTGGCCDKLKKYITTITTTTTTTTSFIWRGLITIQLCFVKIVAVIPRFRTVAMFVTVKW